MPAPPVSKVDVGNYTYGKLNVYEYGKKAPGRLRIGHFCSIAATSKFLLGGEHYLNRLSTYPYKKKLFDIEETVTKGEIVLDDDVWIGESSIILSGVHIHQGAVVAAGAVVTKDVPPYAIVGGNPARIIRYRFEQDIIDAALSIDFSKLTLEFVKEHIDELYDIATINSINYIKDKLEEE